MPNNRRIRRVKPQIPEASSKASLRQVRQHVPCVKFGRRTAHARLCHSIAFGADAASIVMTSPLNRCFAFINPMSPNKRFATD